MPFDAAKVSVCVIKAGTVIRLAVVIQVRLPEIKPCAQ